MYALLEKPGLFQANFAYSPALWRAEYTMGAGHGNNAQVSLPVGLLGFFVE